MIVGICGSHGTGKSTVMKAIEEAGFKTDKTQLSREAQKMLGWDRLSRAEESVQNMWLLQQAIIEALYDRDFHIQKSGQLTAVERTPADVWAYTKLWCFRLGIDVDKDAKALLYKQSCRNLAKNYLKFIFVPINSSIKFEVDPNRADLESRNFIQHEIVEFVWHGMLPVYSMQYVSKEARAAEIQSMMVILNADQKSKMQKDNP